MDHKIGKALVVGAGISGIRASIDLAQMGYRVTLADRAPHMGGILSQLDYQFPTDTLFFHLTRMAHISTACVGCGQCTNACPNDIPLSDLFSYVAHHTQRAFGYGAGLDLSQRPPMCGFEEEEYGEVVGIQ